MPPFENQIQIDEDDLRFVFRVDPTVSPPLSSSWKGSRSAEAEIEFEFIPEHLPATIELHPAENLSISPLKHRITSSSELQSPIQVDFYYTKPGPLNFFVDVQREPDSSYHSNFEVYGPPYQVLEWGQKLLPSRWPSTNNDKQSESSESNWQTSETIIEEVCRLAPRDNYESAISYFIKELRRWLPGWEEYYLIDRCKRIHGGYTGPLTEDGAVEFLAGVLINQSDSPDFELENWNEVIQLTETTRKLPRIPTLHPRDVVQRAVDSLLNDETLRTYPSDLLWKLEERYDLSLYSLESLSKEAVNVLLANAVIQQDYCRGNRIIEAADIDLSTDSVESLISDETAQYFQDLGRNQDYSLPSNAALNKAQAVIYHRLEKTNYERTARHWHQYYRGQRFLRVDRYPESKEAFKNAIFYALQEYSIHGDVQFTRFTSSLIHYYIAISDELQEENKFSEAAQRLDNEALAIIDQFEYFQENPDEKEYAKKRLKALYFEAEGNRYLHNQELRQAASQFGQAVGVLQPINQNDQAEYFQNRCRSIEASLEEQEGEFAEAADTHTLIVDSFEEENKFSQFHRARAKICETKGSIMDWEFHKARQKLSEIDLDWGVAGDEIQYLELLLNELEAYEAGAISDINRVLDELEELSLETNKDLLVSYGHDYRPVFINILAAQRLRQIERMDASITEALIELSLSDVLRPTQVNQVMERRGLSDIQLDEQWMERVPIFTLKQYQEAKKSEASKIGSDNYKDVAENLTGILEQYLHFLAGYYGRREYGSEWQNRVGGPDGRMSLGNLADFLNSNLFDDLPWIQRVRELLSREPYADIVMPDKEGNLADVRNDLDHNNISHLAEDKFQSIKADIEEIFQVTAVEIPVLGKVLGKNVYGAYTIHLFTGGTKNEVEVMTEKDLDERSLYYLPADALGSDTVREMDSKEIVLCESHRIIGGIEKYGQHLGEL